MTKEVNMESLSDERFDEYSKNPDAFVPTDEELKGEDDKGDDDSTDDDSSKGDDDSTDDSKDGDDKDSKDDDDSKSDKSKKDDDDSGDGDDDDDSGSDDSDDDKTPSRFKVPLGKHQKVKDTLNKKISDRDTKIAELESQLGKSETSKEVAEQIEKYAKDNDISVDAVNDLVAIMQRSTGLDDKTKKQLEEFEERSKDLESEKQFNDYYEENISEVVAAINPKAESKKLGAAKKKIQEWAYTKEYLEYRLEDIVALKKDELSKLLETPEKKSSAEGSRSGQGTDDDTPDWANLTPEEIKTLPGDQFDKYSEWMAKNNGGSKLQVTRGDKVVN